MCTKFGENLLSGVGGDALMRRWTPDLQSSKWSRAITMEILAGQQLSFFMQIYILVQAYVQSLVKIHQVM